jgi:hypothetical protein
VSDLLSRTELVKYFRTEEYADEIADIIDNFPPAEGLLHAAQTPPPPPAAVEPAQDVGARLWEALKIRCAAAPDKSKVKALVMVRENDVIAAAATITPPASESPPDWKQDQADTSVMPQVERVRSAYSKEAAERDVEIAQMKAAMSNALTSILQLTAQVEQLRATIDLLERNAGIQAKLLADTGRERDQALSLVEKLRRDLDNSQSLLVMINHIGPSENMWKAEDVANLLTVQVSQNRDSLSSTERQDG